MQAVRTKNVKQEEEKKEGGKECERGGGEGEGGKKKKTSGSVKQHSALMFQGIPGRVNSNSCKNSQPAFTFAGFFFVVFRLHQPLQESAFNFRLSGCRSRRMQHCHTDLLGA